VKKVAFVIASIVISSLPALADDAPKQTPENAHRFLKIVVEQNGMEVEKYTPGVDDSSPPFNRARYVGKDARNPNQGTDDWPVYEGTYTMDPFHAESVEGEGCHSSFKWPRDTFGKMDASWWGDLNINYRSSANIPQNERIHDINFYPDLRDGGTEVDWSKVSGITLEEYRGKARISVIGGGRFTVPTMDLAKRVQFAMEFLKNACDPTASTGF
jgi:hypothetical protein